MEASCELSIWELNCVIKTYNVLTVATAALSESKEHTSGKGGGGRTCAPRQADRLGWPEREGPCGSVAAVTNRPRAVADGRGLRTPRSVWESGSLLTLPGSWPPWVGIGVSAGQTITQVLAIQRENKAKQKVRQYK